MAGGGGSDYTEDDQAEALRIMIREVATVEPVALVWYSAYDQTYFGADPWFQQAFRFEGLISWTGTPKQSWVVWQKLAAAPVTLDER